MRFRIINTIFEYFCSLPHDVITHRLVKIKQTAEGSCFIIIQEIGKATLIELTPQSLAANVKLLEGFSKHDVRTIVYFACEQQHRPKFKILFQESCGKLNRMIFKLRQLGSRNIVAKTAAQISLDKELINHLSQEDVQSISFIAGYEHALEGIEVETKEK